VTKRGNTVGMRSSNVSQVCELWVGRTKTATVFFFFL